MLTSCSKFKERTYLMFEVTALKLNIYFLILKSSSTLTRYSIYNYGNFAYGHNTMCNCTRDECLHNFITWSFFHQRQSENCPASAHALSCPLSQAYIVLYNTNLNFVLVISITWSIAQTHSVLIHEVRISFLIQPHDFWFVCSFGLLYFT